MTPYRILSLDGGGPWALLQVMALQELFKEEGDLEGYDVLKKFDLVAAASGGSIVLAGLLMNRKLSKILDFFFLDRDQRLPIFAPPNWPWSAKYSTKGKWKGLTRILDEAGKRSLSELYGRIRERGRIAPDLLIAAFDCDRRRPEFFRSSVASRSASSKSPATHPTLLDVVHAATTGPPHLFDTPAMVGESRFWDATAGGLYNPILAAIAEARANDHGNIQVLTIGTGTVQLPVRARTSDRANGSESLNQGFVRNEKDFQHDQNSLIRGLFHDPPDMATYIAHVMLGQPLPTPALPQPSGTVVRLNPLIRPRLDGTRGWVSPSGLAADEFRKLTTLGWDAVEQTDVDLIKRFGDLWIRGDVENQAIRASRDYKYEIGHEKLELAKQAWKKLENPERK